MQINQHNLREAENDGVLEAGQAQALWRYLNAHVPETARFSTAHVLYYLGGLLAVGAMTVFMTLGWLRLGGWSLVVLSLCYSVVGVYFLRHFLYHHRLQLPAAIMGTLVVAVIPVGVYGLQHALGVWPPGLGRPDYFFDSGWRWLYMELAALVGGVVLLWRYRLPFMVMPVAATLWLLSLDLSSFFVTSLPTASQLRFLHCSVMTAFGALVLLLALWVDVRSRRATDYAFWLYLAGLLSFWLGLNLYDYDATWWRAGYCLINLGLMGVGAALRRRVFALFGGLGIVRFVGYLSIDVFEDSLLFPLALTVIGGLVIYAGVLWQRYEARVGRLLRRLLPGKIRAGIE